MKQLVLLVLFYSPLTLSMEQPPVRIFSQTNLSAEQAIKLYSQQQQQLNNLSSQTISKTPKLDSYKCAYILGALKPQGIVKLKRKIPEHLGALVAQKKHQGKTLSLSDELELLKWQTYLTQKYSKQPLSKENKK